MSEYQTVSQQVDWWTVHQFVEFYLSRVQDWPVAGTPEWVALEDWDERKMAALLDAARHHALRVDAAQDALAQAAEAVHSAADWRSIAQEINALRNASKAGVRIERVA